MEYWDVGIMEEWNGETEWNNGMVEYWDIGRKIYLFWNVSSQSPRVCFLWSDSISLSSPFSTL